NQFPIVEPGFPLGGNVFDREIRTPYFHQYNLSIQGGSAERLVFEAAYAGSRGLDLLRQIAINQARLATVLQPITNGVTSNVITTNSLGNAALRTPYQGVDSMTLQIQSSGQSTYNSLQLSLTQRKFRGMQFLASYTYSKSMDNGSGVSASTGDVLDTTPTLGNQLDPRANRGLSDFDRTHRFVLSYIWKLPRFSNWQ